MLRNTCDLFPADGDFEPTMEEEDDEETIEVEEQQEGNDAETHQREIELLKEEGLLPLDQLLSTLKLPQVQNMGSFVLQIEDFRVFVQFFCNMTGSVVFESQTRALLQLDKSADGTEFEPRQKQATNPVGTRTLR